MYKKKTIASAISSIIASALIFGLMIMFAMMPLNLEQFGLAAIFVLLFIFGAYVLIFVSALPFAIVTLVYGIRLLKQPSRKKLIAHNKSVLAAALVLLPFLAIGVFGGITMVTASEFDLIPIVYLVLAGCAYLACIVTSIVSLVLLNKSPEEVEAPPVNGTQN